jgi:hypothetical protein
VSVAVEIVPDRFDPADPTETGLVRLHGDVVGQDDGILLKNWSATLNIRFDPRLLTEQTV